MNRRETIKFSKDWKFQIDIITEKSKLRMPVSPPTSDRRSKMVYIWRSYCRIFRSISKVIA